MSTVFSDFLTNFEIDFWARCILGWCVVIGTRGCDGKVGRAVGFAVDRTPGTAQVPSATTLTVTPGLSVSPHSR